MKTNLILLNSEYVKVQSIEEYCVFRHSDNYKLIVTKAILKLKRKRKFKNIDFLEFATSLDECIQYIKLDFISIPYYRLFFSEVIKHIELKLAEQKFARSEFKSYDDIITYQLDFKNFTKYFDDLGLPNFTHQQQNETEIVRDSFDEKKLKEYIKLLILD